MCSRGEAAEHSESLERNNRKSSPGIGLTERMESNGLVVRFQALIFGLNLNSGEFSYASLPVAEVTRLRGKS